MKIEKRIEELFELVGDGELYRYEASEKTVELLDIYAIEFAEWCLNESIKPGFFLLEDGTYRYKHKSSYTNKQLLEIFKKEKGL